MTTLAYNPSLKNRCDVPPLRVVCISLRARFSFYMYIQSFKREVNSFGMESWGVIWFEMKKKVSNDPRGT